MGIIGARRRGHMKVYVFDKELIGTRPQIEHKGDRRRAILEHGDDNSRGKHRSHGDLY